MQIDLFPARSFHQVGRRNHQEDARFPDSDQSPADSRTFIVCDGVGGLAHGEIASSTVAHAIGEFMESMDLSQELDPHDFGPALAAANDSLRNFRNQSTGNMATTLTCVAFHAGGALCAHIGDSRIYQIRPGVGIIYRSNDHSLVNSLVHSGVITPEEVENHPQSNVITRCMGFIDDHLEEPSAAVINISDIQPDDYFFLCSDGVTAKISDKKLTEIISFDISDEEKIEILATLSENSHDNNTAYLIHIDNVEGGEISDENDIEPESPSQTKSLESPPDQIMEIHPRQPSHKNSISSFLKNIFRR